MEDKAYAVLCVRLGGAPPDPAALGRAADALYRRGFSWEEIKTAVGKYRGEHRADRSDYSEVIEYSDED
jgi:SOS response regulatory protein OraA/RecX